ncbi:MAG TPA: RNA polymerase sigma factor SigJ [Lacisediminihabitans sp.]|nr:RNA polymerase sigma factor SigJ [Lacisediminihabitans sp.]HXD61436.1 RNA polymerase sigma factor SigJ [Lacisediminihabitans sp.]
MESPDPRLAELTAERNHLMSLGYRMLGTVADAEDAVQETYARWYRMTPDERDAIEVPRAWLTRVAGRVCLDMLGTARARREHYVGEWLPEPVPGTTFALDGPASDPLDRVTLDDSVSTALLIVLESLTPAERVAFVLHDVFAVPFPEIAEIVGRTADACRQLATSARRRIREHRSAEVATARHDSVVQAFVAACTSGDLAALVTVLDPDVVLRSDGGGLVSAARNPVRGALNVARFLLGILSKEPGMEVTLRESANGMSLVARVGGTLLSVVDLGVAREHDAISDVWIMMNPEKLTLWGAE